jgi:acyl carrier protein
MFEEEKLIRCFLAVFPMATPDEIQSSGPDWFADKDSLAVVTLWSVIQEEFGVEIDTSDFADLTSYEAFALYLRQHGSAAR